MKIAYVENIRLPTEKAHGIQIMKMCESFAYNGHEVQLFISKRKDNKEVDPFIYYNVDRIFTIKQILLPNLLSFGRIGFLIQTIIFSEIASWYISSFKPDIVYSRDERILFNYILRFRNLVWEAHRGSWNFITKLLMSFSKKIIVISNGLKDLYTEKSIKFSNKIVLAPDGVDLDQFTISSINKDECRRRLNLPLNKKIILYAGHLYKWKGVDTLAEISKSLKEDEIIIFVGGTSYDIESFKKAYENNNCMILGQKPHSEIPLYLKSADVLILPNSARENIGSIYTSPLKLFEYMASGVPIVASDVPAIREILNDSNAIFALPDNPNSFLDAINSTFMHPDLSKERALMAMKDVENYSWQERAKKILSSIDLLI